MKLRSIFCIHFPESGIDRSQLISIVFRPGTYFPAEPVKCLLFIFFVCQILCIELKYVILFVVEYIGAALLTKILEPYGIIKFVKPEISAADLIQPTIFILNVGNQRYIGTIVFHPGKQWKCSILGWVYIPKILIKFQGVYNIVSFCFLVAIYTPGGDSQVVQIKSTANWRIWRFFCYRDIIVSITHVKIKLILSNRHQLTLLVLYGCPHPDRSLTSVFAIRALYMNIGFAILLDKGNILQEIIIDQLAIFILNQFQREVLNVFASHFLVTVSPLMMQGYRQIHSSSRKHGIIVIRINRIQVVHILFYIEFCLMHLRFSIIVVIRNLRRHLTRTLGIKIPSTVRFCHFKNIVIAFQFNTGDPECVMISLRMIRILYIAFSFFIDPDILIYKNGSIVILKMVLIPRFCKIQTGFICIQNKFALWLITLTWNITYYLCADHKMPPLFQLLISLCKSGTVNVEFVTL